MFGVVGFRGQRLDCWSLSFRAEALDCSGLGLCSVPILWCGCGV